MNKTITTKRMCHISDIANLALIEFRSSPHPKGPANCFKCGQPFKKGEAWRRLTSPADPELGAYVMGIHQQCPRANRH